MGLFSVKFREEGIGMQLIEQGAISLKNLEARGGFEPPHKGFADLSLNHLGTAPFRETGLDRHA